MNLRKFELFQFQLGRATLTHFAFFAVGKWNFLIFISLSMQQVIKSDVMSWSRIPEIRRYEIKVKLFVHPFDLAVEVSPDDCQMELIEPQADMDTKMGYSNNSYEEITNSILVECFQNCPIMQEKLSPSLVAPAAVSNSFNRRSSQNQMSKSADWWTFDQSAKCGYHICQSWYWWAIRGLYIWSVPLIWSVLTKCKIVLLVSAYNSLFWKNNSSVSHA